MENRAKVRHNLDAEGSAPFRAAPFVTILDGAATKAKKSPATSRLAAPRQRARRMPTMELKKSGTRFLSYMEDSFGKITETAKEGFGRIQRVKLPVRKTEEEIPPPASGRPSPSFPSWLARILMTRNSSARIIRISLLAFIAVLTLSASAGVIFSARNFPVAVNGLLLPDEESVQKALIAYVEPDTDPDKAALAGNLPPIPVSVSMRNYTIRSGDTIEKIAKRYGLRQDTIISANNLQSASSIRPGLALRIPNMDGVSHKVRKGENLSSLSKSYGIDITKIVDANDLSTETISLGQNLFIPNARLSASNLRNFYGEKFVWPVRGRISSSFGYRANPFTGLRTYHSAIDIVVSTGTRVKATADGTVADTGYNSVFGNYIILRHSSGYQSLYAHLSSIAVREGSSIAQGGNIGLSGNSGQSTGPHLHFSIFKNGQALDPVKYVK